MLPWQKHPVRLNLAYMVVACELVAITFICYRFMGLPDVLLTRSSQALAARDS
jgi:hypothetical protein